MLASSLLASLFIFGAPLSQEQSWRTYNMERLFMSAELPVRPEPFNYQVNKSTNKVQFNAWMAANLGETYVIFAYTVYYKGDNVVLDQASKGAIDTLTENIKDPKMTFNVKKIKFNGMDARKLYAQFTMKGDKSVYSAIMVAKDRRLWQAMVTYPADAAISKTVDRVMNSIKISPK